MWALYFVCAALLGSLTIYAITGGADYGGGVLELFASGPRADKQREVVEHAIGPIWESNHVWLILVIVMLFCGFPEVYATIMTSLFVPVVLMLIGIVLRGSAFSFRSYGAGGGEMQRIWGRVFAVASLITPYLLGVIIAAIASGQIPENPHVIGDFVFPWLTPFCMSVGLFTLMLFSYLAATYATLEPADPAVSDDFRLRAIGFAFAAGVMAAEVLLLSRTGAPRIWRGLVDRAWTWPLIWLTSGLALGALFCLWTRRYQIARICAAGQVALIIWGWAFAQFPVMVEPSLTIYNASAPPITLRLLAIALAVGVVVLLPSFGYLMLTFKIHSRRLPFPHRRTSAERARRPAD
jgi:cytochrome d ubiquinol oxidase subunit II